MVVYLVQCSVCEDGSNEHYIEGIFNNIESARKKMKSEFEIDAYSEHGVISQCFEEGIFQPQSDEDYCEIRENSISLYSMWDYMQYNIWIEAVEVED